MIALLLPIAYNTQTSSRASYSSGDVQVVSCLFQSITNSYVGGAIYASSSVTSLSVIDCGFQSCYTSNYGTLTYECSATFTRNTFISCYAHCEFAIRCYAFDGTTTIDQFSATSCSTRSWGTYVDTRTVLATCINITSCSAVTGPPGLVDGAWDSSNYRLYVLIGNTGADGGIISIGYTYPCPSISHSYGLTINNGPSDASIVDYRTICTVHFDHMQTLESLTSVFSSGDATVYFTSCYFDMASVNLYATLESCLFNCATTILNPHTCAMPTAAFTSPLVTIPSPLPIIILALL